MHSHLYVQLLEREAEDREVVSADVKTPVKEVSGDINTAVMAIIHAARNKDWSLFEEAVAEAAELMPGVAEGLADL